MRETPTFNGSNILYALKTLILMCQLKVNIALGQHVISGIIRVDFSGGDGWPKGVAGADDTLFRQYLQIVFFNSIQIQSLTLRIVLVYV